MHIGGKEKIPNCVFDSWVIALNEGTCFAVENIFRIWYGRAHIRSCLLIPLAAIYGRETFGKTDH